jgi:hypothetical protein
MIAPVRQHKPPRGTQKPTERGQVTRAAEKITEEETTMKFNMKRTIAALAVVVILATGPSFAGSGAPAAPAIASPERDHFSVFVSGQASRLLADIQDEAADLVSNAQILATLNPLITWHSHATYLIEVKRHINIIGVRLDELQRMRQVMPAWQQQAAAETYAHALQVAASTEAAITHLRENQERVFAPAYQGHLRSIAGSSENLKQTVDKFLQYEKSQQQLQRLQRELEL